MGGPDDTNSEPRAELDRHLQRDDCEGLDRAVIIELGETTARTTVFESEDEQWTTVGPPAEARLRGRPDVDYRADLARVAADASVHISPGMMTDFVLSGSGAHEPRVVALFRDRLGTHRVFTAPGATTGSGRGIFVGVGVLALLIVVGGLTGLVVTTGGDDSISVLGATTERPSAETAPTSPTSTSTVVPPTTVESSTTAGAPIALDLLDPNCQAVVFDEPGAVGRSWTFASGEHDLLLEPRNAVRSITIDGANCQALVCTGWSGDGPCTLLDEGSHDLEPDLADGVSYLAVG